MPTTIQTYPINHIPYHIQIPSLIKSSKNLSAQQQKRITKFAILIWDLDENFFAPASIAHQYQDILNDKNSLKFIINLAIAAFSENRTDTKQLANTSSQDEQLGLVLNIKDMTIFMVRLIDILKSNKLFFTENTKKESSIFLTVLFDKIDEALDIISTGLYNNKFLSDYKNFVTCHDSLVSLAQETHSNLAEIIQHTPSLESDLILKSKKWPLYKAKCFFALGKDQEANQELVKIDGESSSDLVLQKTSILAEIESNSKRKTYIQILEVQKNKELAPSEKKANSTLETKSQLKKILENLTNEKLEVTLKKLSKKILKRSTPDENLTLEAIDALHLVRSKPDITISNLDLCVKIYTKLVELTQLDTPFTPIQSIVTTNLSLEIRMLTLRKILRTSESNLLNKVSFTTNPKPRLDEQQSVKKTKKIKKTTENKVETPRPEIIKEEPIIIAPEKIEPPIEIEEAVAIIIDDADNENKNAAKLEEKRAKEEARRIAKKSRRDARKNLDNLEQLSIPLEASKISTIDEKARTNPVEPEQELPQVLNQKAPSIHEENENKSSPDPELSLDKKLSKNMLKKLKRAEKNRNQPDSKSLLENENAEALNVLKQKALEEKAKKKEEKKLARKTRKEQQAACSSSIARPQNLSQEQEQENKPEENIVAASVELPPAPATLAIPSSEPAQVEPAKEQTISNPVDPVLESPKNELVHDYEQKTQYQQDQSQVQASHPTQTDISQQILALEAEIEEYQTEYLEMASDYSQEKKALKQKIAYLENQVTSLAQANSSWLQYTNTFLEQTKNTLICAQEESVQLYQNLQSKTAEAAYWQEQALYWQSIYAQTAPLLSAPQALFTPALVANRAPAREQLVYPASSRRPAPIASKSAHKTAKRSVQKK